MQRETVKQTNLKLNSTSVTDVIFHLVFSFVFVCLCRPCTWFLAFTFAICRRPSVCLSSVIYLSVVCM